ncbi:hypothetical protein FHS27_000227 [Rhodopirellula rubra]|uniref:Uncharacterized protein n=1 Tax=Aporhodopirellula rubra TaxID=980271 RepID=A0A7W5DUS8_9BACT|nr:hypothetical protein [Aporhodopirellula rubra]
MAQTSIQRLAFGTSALLVRPVASSASPRSNPRLTPVARTNVAECSAAGGLVRRSRSVRPHFDLTDNENKTTLQNRRPTQCKAQPAAALTMRRNSINGFARQRETQLMQTECTCRGVILFRRAQLHQSPRCPSRPSALVFLQESTYDVRMYRSHESLSCPNTPQQKE